MPTCAAPRRATSEALTPRVRPRRSLTNDMDESNLNLMRAAELKHGRVAMLATVGWAWTATGTHFTGTLSKSQKITFDELAQLDNLAAAAKVPSAGIWQIIIVCGIVEVTWERMYPSNKSAGNYGVPAMTQDPEKLKELELAELKHGVPRSRRYCAGVPSRAPR